MCLSKDWMILMPIVKEYFGNEEELVEYLSGAVGGNLLRLKNGAVHGTVTCLLRRS